MQSSLSKNILQTVIYYDILNFPLTSFEIWKFLIGQRGCSLGEILEALENDDVKNKTEEFRGFYFLTGRKNLVDRRIQNDKNSIVKFEIANKVAKRLRYVPFVRMIAVTGTLAMKNSEKSSDIDFFVAIEKNRLFAGRLLATAMVHALRKRRYGNKIKNRICLNYFVAADHLEIPRKDLFAANEYSFVYPLFGQKVFHDFCRQNVDWIRKFKPNWRIPELEPARYFSKHSRISRNIQDALEYLIDLLFGDRIETWLKRKQIARIERNPLTHKSGAYIEYTDQNLIFLPEPQGVRIEEEWQRRMETLTL